MKTKILIILVLLSGLLGCSDKSTKDDHANEVTYTCSMHPQIVQSRPGTCPVCGMDLVIFDRNNQEASVTLDSTQILLANIRTRIFGDTSINSFTRLNGRVVTNPEKSTIISSRVAGRVEQLFVRETGVQVKRGQTLYRIYSEQLSALQQEYLLAVAQIKEFPGNIQFEKIGESARQKLLLYGQTQGQLDNLKRSGKADAYISYASPSAGTVSSISIAEGQYVEEGAAMMEIENYDDLWIEGDVYPSEIAGIRVGQAVMVSVVGNEAPRKMTIDFIDPVLQPGMQVLKIRGTLNNNNNLQPGMKAEIVMPVGKTSTSLSVPPASVLRNGKSSRVWVEKSKNIFVPAEVQTGVENTESIQIISGLTAGDKVVITGAYLLNSEYLLKKGGTANADHQH